jgi:hypothetical protein
VLTGPLPAAEYTFRLTEARLCQEMAGMTDDSPIAARDVVAAAGALLVLRTIVSMVGSHANPAAGLTRLVASGAGGIFGLVVRPVPSYQ